MPKPRLFPGLALGLSLAFGTTPALSDQPLRIKQLQRCGDLLQTQEMTFCLRATGLDGDTADLRVLLDGKPVAQDDLLLEGETLRLTLRARERQSGPLWLERGEHRSNAAWLSLQSSHVLAARPDQVAKNMDGLTTYVDLISVVIEENHDGLEEARRLAKRYGADVVGAIPPLNTYQLRLPAANLTERDALVLRIGSEISVDAVVIEESSPERGESEHRPQTRPAPEEWAANRFIDAVNYYRRRIPAGESPIEPTPVRIGVIERDVDFDAPDFSDYLGACEGERRTCLYARDGDKPDGHGSTVAGIFAAGWNQGGNTGFLRGLDDVGGGFEVIVDRNSDAGILGNIAASVNLVEDGARILNWSWGIHRLGALDVKGDEVDSLVRSGLAFSGYEELLEEFFLWLRMKHPDVIVVNSAGNGSSFSSADEYRLPSSFVTEQLLVVGGHQRSDEKKVSVSDPRYVERRASSNLDMRVDISASACAEASTREAEVRGEPHCGTSYATPMVAGVAAAMLSINPDLTPEQVRILLRRSAMALGDEFDFEPTDADDLTAPILPSERGYELDNKDVGRSARLDMQKALDLTVRSRDRVR